MKYETMKPHTRHTRDSYYIVGEGIHTYNDKNEPTCSPVPDDTKPLDFRFSRLGPKGKPVDEEILKKVAKAMTGVQGQPDSANATVPAGFTYLGQFIDHDLTQMNVPGKLGDPVDDGQLMQGRSPRLDLDSLYGGGPKHATDKKFYSDEAHLKVGTTAKTEVPDGAGGRTDRDLAGFDLPRVGEAAKDIAEQRMPAIPDARNDENLAVGQTHLAFMRFHNRVVDKIKADARGGKDLFEAAREEVVKHYQWMIRTDFLPRVVDKSILDDVFKNGRKFFEPDAKRGTMPTMPVEFSVAAYRLGHSMIRDVYQWNRVFRQEGLTPATLALLFNFSGTSGTLSPPGAEFKRLPTNWVADFRRLYDFNESGRADLGVAPDQFNLTKRIDTAIVDPLKQLPFGSFGERDPKPAPPEHERNLAFRNLARANMVQLASGQQMADKMGVAKLDATQILRGKGDGGVDLNAELDAKEKDAFTTNTPLWFYVLREAEINGGKLTGVGGRICAEVFHRCMESSRCSMIRDALWRPSLGPDRNTFRMVDLLLFAFEGKAELLNPLGD